MDDKKQKSQWECTEVFNIPSHAPLASVPYQYKKHTAESVAEMICSVMRKVVRGRPFSKKMLRSRQQPDASGHVQLTLSDF